MGGQFDTTHRFHMRDKSQFARADHTNNLGWDLCGLIHVGCSAELVFKNVKEVLVRGGVLHKGCDIVDDTTCAAANSDKQDTRHERLIRHFLMQSSGRINFYNSSGDNSNAHLNSKIGHLCVKSLI